MEDEELVPWYFTVLSHTRATSLSRTVLQPDSCRCHELHTKVCKHGKLLNNCNSFSLLCFGLAWFWFVFPGVPRVRVSVLLGNDHKENGWQHWRGWPRLNEWVFSSLRPPWSLMSMRWQLHARVFCSLRKVSLLHSAVLELCCRSRDARFSFIGAIGISVCIAKIPVITCNVFWILQRFVYWPIRYCSTTCVRQP